MRFDLSACRSFFPKFMSVVYFLGLVMLCLSALWPKQLWWIVNFVLVIPPWLFYIPAVAGLIYGAVTKREIIALFNFLSILIIFFGITGWNVPSPQWSQPKQQKALTILSANLGEGGQVSSLNKYVAQIEPDVVLLQEPSYWVDKFFKDTPPEGWYIHFGSGFGIVSRYRIIDVDVLTRETFDRKGIFLVEYLLEGPHGPLHLFNVHLETPRKGVQPIIEGGPGALSEMVKVTEWQAEESSLASARAARRKNAIVAGDFNLVTLNPIFQAYWSRFQDAFSKAGWGFGHTKYTGWYGARIDHILVDDNWQVMDAGAGPDLGGDHRPVYARLAFVGEPEEFPDQPEPDMIRNSVPPEDIYFYKDFSSMTGKTVTLPLEEWPMETYPRVQFSYRIPPEVPVVVKVLTRFNDWICLGGTPAAECSQTKSKEYFTLINDGQWHNMDLNADKSIKSVLKALERIKEWQFVIPLNRHLKDGFWVDNFMISK